MNNRKKSKTTGFYTVYSYNMYTIFISQNGCLIFYEKFTVLF
jgi:hypothetical protein